MKFQLVCTHILESCDWSVQTHWSEGAHVWSGALIFQFHHLRNALQRVISVVRLAHNKCYSNA